MKSRFPDIKTPYDPQPTERLRRAPIFESVPTALELVRQFGRRTGRRGKADRFALEVLKLVGERQLYRKISHRFGLSKNTVLDTVKRDRAA